jgi:hypothetical protein
VLLPISSSHAPLVDGSISLRPEFNGGQPMTLDFELEGGKPMLELDLGADDDAPAGSGKPDPGKRVN